MIRLLTFLPFLLFALGLFNPSTAKAASMYQVNNGTAVTINEWGVCQIVTNNRGIGIMVPTNTAAEWANFRAGVPSGVSLAGCITFSWQAGGWGGCSNGCGGGVQYRSVWCQGSDGGTYPDGNCGGGRPADNQGCTNYGGCSYWWATGGWGGCNVGCGWGTQYRSVWCQRSDGAAVGDGYCGGGRPADNQGCYPGDCPDDYPNPFSFVNQSGLDTDEYIYSNIVQITGINVPATVYVTPNNGEAFFRVCGGASCGNDPAWISASGSSTVTNGNYVQIRRRSSYLGSTTSTTNLYVGSGSTQWQITTAACGGTKKGGYCWYYGGNNKSCTQVCSSRGGYDSAGTRDYAGSNGTNSNCDKVLEALGAPALGAIYTETWGGQPYGCAYNGNRARYTTATTAGGTADGVRRACACNN